MRPLIHLSLALVTAVVGGCGGGDAVAPAVAPSVPQVTAKNDDAIVPADIGCQKLGLRIDVQAMHEFETAVLVLRDGKLVRGECVVNRHASDQRLTYASGILAFAPDGPLRPGSDDHLVIAVGRRFTAARSTREPIGFGPDSAVEIGEQWERVACWLVPSGASSTSTLLGNDCAFGVWLFVRQTPIGPDHELYAKLDGAGYYAVSREGSLDEVLRLLLPSAEVDTSATEPLSRPAAGGDGF